MSIVDETISKAKAVADVTAKKATEIANVTKANVKLYETNNTLGEVYEELGKIVYSAVKNETEYGEDVEEKIRVLDELIQKKSALIKEIADLKGKKICGQCQSVNDGESSFCSKCGNQF